MSVSLTTDTQIYEDKEITCAKIVCTSVSTYRFTNIVSAPYNYEFQGVIRATGDRTITVICGDSYADISVNTTFMRYIVPFPNVTIDTVDSLYLVFPAGTYYLYNLQLERGTVPTQWQPAPEDTTTEAAKVTKSLLEQVTQLDVYNRLTNNGETQGIYLEDGQLYINASYIHSGVFSADYIFGGKISDVSGNNFWDLTTGELNINAVSGTIDGSNIETTDSTADLRYQMNEVLQHFHIRDDAGLEIITDDGTAIILSNGEVLIRDAGQISTDIVGKDITSGSLTLSEYLSVGNHKLLARSNGTNSTLVYVGD